MFVQIEIQENAAVVRCLEDRIDCASSPSLSGEMMPLLESHSGPIILDLSIVDSIDSSGIGAIAGVAKRLSDDQTFCVAGVHDAVRSAFALSRLDRVIQLFETPAAAIEALSAPKKD